MRFNLVLNLLYRGEIPGILLHVGRTLSEKSMMNQLWGGYQDSLFETARQAPTIVAQGGPS